MKMVIAVLIEICLFSASCDEWRSFPVETDVMKTDVDHSKGYVPLSGKNQQNYISLAKVSFTRDNLISRSMVHIVLSDGKSKWQIGPGDLDSAFEVETSMSGVLTMDFTIMSAEGVTVSAGTVSWPLKPDYRLSIFLERSTHDPKVTCWGCSGSKSFPILNANYKESERDAIFVVWGWNSISNPIHY